MNRFFKHSVPALGLLGLALSSCQPTLESPAVSAGSADFTTYIAVGNSLTAGYSDDGLYREGQLNSYPNILSQQFAIAGGGTFTQPLFTEAQASGSGYLKLAGFTAAGLPITARVPGTAGRVTPTAAPYTKFTDPINNLGVPGIRLSDIQTPGYGSVLGNPYFERITTNPLQTYFNRLQTTVAALKPTFFTFWLGNNDVLSYATAGGAVATAPITNVDTFRLKANRALNVLVSGGAKGVVSTIPDVAGVPFFTTVGPSFRATLAAANIPAAAPFIYTTGILAPGAANTRVATSTLADIRVTTAAAGTTGTLLLTLTSSPYVALYGQPTGKYWRDFYAQAKATLPATVPNLSVFLTAMAVDTTKAFGMSTGNPFPSTLVLDATEQATVATATTAFNTALTAAATTRNLAVFDANTYFKGIAISGQASNGVNNTAAFVSGNLFGLDGVHPTPRGYALIANEILRAINAKYNSSFQGVNANSYRGVVFP